MKFKYLIQPIFVAAWISALLQTIPVVKNFSFWIIIPNMPIIAGYLIIKSNKLTEKLKYNQILTIALLTGISAAVITSIFDLIITFITKTHDIVTYLPEIENVISQMPAMQTTYFKEALAYLYKISSDITTYGFSLEFMVLTFINFIMINIFLSFLGSFFTYYYTNNVILPNLTNKGE